MIKPFRNAYEAIKKLFTGFSKKKRQEEEEERIKAEAAAKAAAEEERRRNSLGARIKRGLLNFGKKMIEEEE